MRLISLEKDWFLYWSDTCDALGTRAMSGGVAFLSLMEDLSRKMDSDLAQKQATRIINRARQNSTEDIKGLQRYNRAGPNETKATLEEIIRWSHEKEE